MGGSCSSTKNNITIPTRVIKVREKNSQLRIAILKQISKYDLDENKDQELNKNDNIGEDQVPIENNNIEESKRNHTLKASNGIKYDLKIVGIGEHFLEKELLDLTASKTKKNVYHKKLIKFEKIISNTHHVLGPNLLDMLHKLYNKTDICLLQYSKRKPQQYLNLFKHEGPPMKYRWSLWKNRLDLDQYYIADLFEKMRFLTTSYENDIKKDIHRTFPEEAYFSSELFNYIGQEQLFRVLKAIAIYLPNVGYCQGMNFIVAFLLLVNGGNEQETFWFFVGLARSHDYLLMGFFERNFPLLNLYHHVFYEVFKKELPKLHEYLSSQQIPDQLWITKWLLTMFLYSLPPCIVVRIWDYIFSENLFALIKVSVGLLKMIEKDLMNLDTLGFDILLKHIKGDKKKVNQDDDYTFIIKDIDPEILISISKKIILTNENVSQYTIEYIKQISVDLNDSIYYKFYSDYHTNVRSPTFLREFQKEIDQFLIKYELMGQDEESEKQNYKYIAEDSRLLVMDELDL